MVFWRIKDYCPNPPENPIQDWYDEQVEEVAIAFEFVVRMVARTEDWRKSELRPLIVPLEEPYAGLYEILIDAELSEEETILIRPIGVWRPDSSDLIILQVSTKRADDYYPPLSVALELRLRWEAGEGRHMIEKFRQIWQKFRKSKKYREQFVAAQVKRGIPFQIRSLMKKQGLSQEKLALKSGLTQGVISRAADPNNGNLTLNTIIRVAAGFDVAFVGMFVPFSELVNWYSNMSEESGNILTFTEEDEGFNNSAVAAKADVNTLQLGDLESQLHRLQKTGKAWRVTGKYKAKTEEDPAPSAMDALTEQPTIQ